MADKSAIDALTRLFNLNQEDNAAAVFQSQALLSENTARESLEAHAKRMGAVQDAYWKSKCPDYEPPEEDVGSNFINCSIVSDKAISQLAQIIGDGDNTPTDPPTQPPVQPPVVEPPEAKPKWWKVVLGTLAAVLLGATLIFAAWQLFAGNQGRYELIAEPFEPPSPLEFNR